MKIGQVDETIDTFRERKLTERKRITNSKSTVRRLLHINEQPLKHTDWTPCIASTLLHDTLHKEN